MTLWQLICMSFISDMAKFFWHCYEALSQYILCISLNKIDSQLHLCISWAYHHVIGRRTYLQYIMIAPCLHTSCFILNWIYVILSRQQLWKSHIKRPMITYDTLTAYLHVLNKLVMWLSFSGIVMKLWVNIFFVLV